MHRGVVLKYCIVTVNYNLKIFIFFLNSFSLSLWNGENQMPCFASKTMNRFLIQVTISNVGIKELYLIEESYKLPVHTSYTEI